MINKKPQETFPEAFLIGEVCMKVRQHMKITGRVQGVGFRYTAKNAASSLGLTGWVKNECDGSVSMEVQGEKEKIDKMMDIIDKSPFIEMEHVFSQVVSLNAGDCYFEVKEDW